MSDYIKRESRTFIEIADDLNDLVSELNDKIVELIREKNADAVPVVRCKDCRYYQDNNGGYPNTDCKWCKDETPDANDYCSCGERNEKAKGEY